MCPRNERDVSDARMIACYLTQSPCDSTNPCCLLPSPVAVSVSAHHAPPSLQVYNRPLYLFCRFCVPACPCLYARAKPQSWTMEQRNPKTTGSRPGSSWASTGLEMPLAGSRRSRPKCRQPVCISRHSRMNIRASPLPGWVRVVRLVSASSHLAWHAKADRSVRTAANFAIKRSPCRRHPLSLLEMFRATSVLSFWPARGRGRISTMC